MSRPRALLMVAFHFPPMSGSSGILRTLSFVRELPALGWLPAVLSAHPRCYPGRSDELVAQIPPAVTVRRAFALDTARHLALAGRYPQALALPDRWISWLPGAVVGGLALIRKLRPAVLWSTYPIATAHLIGDWLARLSGRPWIADFRDPMAHDGYPADPTVWQRFLRVEQRVFARAARIVFATPGAAALYRQRYPAAAERIVVIENGYDEAAFAAVEAATPARAPLTPGALTLLHSGIVYPEWRHPEHLFAALRRLLDEHLIRPDTFRLRFRAAGHDDFLRPLIDQYGLQAIVELRPPIPYHEALQEMRQADALLILQSAGCNDQIPAKLYEYLRAGRPILGLADAAGDTAQTLRAAGYRHLAALESAAGIAAVLREFLADVAQGTAPLASAAAVAAASRTHRAHELAAVLDAVADAASRPLAGTPGDRYHGTPAARASTPPKHDLDGSQ